MNIVKDYIIKLGFLRTMLTGTAIITILFKPVNGGTAVFEGIGLITTIIIPVLAPLIFMLLLLDIIMSNVLRVDAEGEVRDRFNMILKSNILTCVLLLIFWVPFFRALG
jgi:hypothetical protein